MGEKELNDATNEVNVLKILQHPNIIGYHTSFVEDGYLSIVMDYAEGINGSSIPTFENTPTDIIKAETYLHRSTKLKTHENYSTKRYEISTNSPQILKQIAEWGLQLSSALQHIHSKNILHRDLKTQNIFLTNDFQIKLGDFGIAKLLTASHDFAKTVIGTPYYLR